MTKTFKHFLNEDKKELIDQGFLDHLDLTKERKVHSSGSYFVKVAPVKDSSKNWGGQTRKLAILGQDETGNKKIVKFVSSELEAPSALNFQHPDKAKAIQNPFVPPSATIEPNTTYVFDHTSKSIYKTGKKSKEHSPNLSAFLNGHDFDGSLPDTSVYGLYSRDNKEKLKRGDRRTDFTVGDSLNISLKTSSHEEEFNHKHFKRAQELVNHIKTLEPNCPFSVSYSHENSTKIEKPRAFIKMNDGHQIHSVPIDEFTSASNHASLASKYNKKVDWSLNTPDEKRRALRK